MVQGGTRGTLVIPDSVVEALIDAEDRTCREISHLDVRRAIAGMPAEGAGVLSLVAPYIRSHDDRVLDVGCGNGFGLCHLLRAGARAIGVEPGRTTSFEGRSQRAVEILKANGFDPTNHFVTAVAEQLPFASGVFDVVVGSAVLEHVKDVDSALREALRVTRPGGVVVMTVPNYDSFYEPHYRTAWLPYALHSRTMARFWVGRILRRPTYYIEELNFTSPSRLRTAIQRAGAIRTSRVYPMLPGPLAPLSAFHYHLTRRPGSKHRAVEVIRRMPLLARSIGIVVGIGVSVLAGCGLATMLLLVCEVASSSPRSDRSSARA
jgi:SAM-dependent methyltransferase